MSTGFVVRKLLINKYGYDRIFCLVKGAMKLAVWGANIATNELETFVIGCIDLGFNAFGHADIYGE